MRRGRVGLGAAGILLMLFGAFRMFTEIPFSDLIVLAVWLIGALVIHDGILSPVVVAVGWAISRVTPPRARRYLQAALIVGALVTVIAIPMIYRRNSQPKSKAILQQNFGVNLTVLLALIAAVTLIAYAVAVARGRLTRPGRAWRAKVMPGRSDTTRRPSPRHAPLEEGDRNRAHDNG